MRGKEAGDLYTGLLICWPGLREDEGDPQELDPGGARCCPMLKAEPAHHDIVHVVPNAVFLLPPTLVPISPVVNLNLEPCREGNSRKDSSSLAAKLYFLSAWHSTLAFLMILKFQIKAMVM
jgi:hypothetical protein